MCESTLQAKKCLKSANTTTITIVIKELFFLIFKKYYFNKKEQWQKVQLSWNNCQYFYKRKEGMVQYLYSQKKFKYVMAERKVKHLMPEANRVIPCSITSNDFFGTYFLQFSIIQAQKKCI